MKKYKIALIIFFFLSVIFSETIAASLTSVSLTQNVSVTINSSTMEEYRSTYLSYNIAIPSNSLPANGGWFLAELMSSKGNILYQASSKNEVTTPSINYYGPVYRTKNHKLIYGGQEYTTISIPIDLPLSNNHDEGIFTISSRSGVVLYSLGLSLQKNVKQSSTIRAWLSKDGDWIYVNRIDNDSNSSSSAVVSCTKVDRSESTTFYTFEKALKANSPDNCLELTITVQKQNDPYAEPLTEFSLSNPFDYRLDSPREGLSATLRRKLPLYYVQAWQHENITSALPYFPLIEGDEKARHP